MVLASVFRLRHFGTCATEIEGKIESQVCSLFTNGFELVILLNLGHKLTFFTFWLVGTWRWYVETLIAAMRFC